MVLDDLKEIVLAVFEDHEDAFLFEDDFRKVNDVPVGKLGAEGHLTDGGLGYARVLYCLILFVGLEPGRCQSLGVHVDGKRSHTS